MTDPFVPFDEMRRRVADVLTGPGAEAIQTDTANLYLVRDLMGRLRIFVSDALETNDAIRNALDRFAQNLRKSMGVRAYPAEECVLFVGEELLRTLADTAEKIGPQVFLADRLVTGRGWWTVSDAAEESTCTRITLYSIKGGVGRSTTAAVLAWHLARNGERVLVVDMDLESPGLSSLVLEANRRPRFGLIDWFVEDLVGQGCRVTEDMLGAPAWTQTCEGDVRVAPAHGHDPGEYLAKLGRLYVDMFNEPWTKRMERMLTSLETIFEPSVVLLESRSGLHDIAAESVTDLQAEVLLFGTNSESNWCDYSILLHHWLDRNLAEIMRERISIVSSLTPIVDRESYLQNFRTQAWDLFRDNLYDKIDCMGDALHDFSFDLEEINAPHDPMEISWTPDFFQATSL